ncbi:MAG: hypothetical protein KatS3mg060_1325 [Dehalococcoidia bacterium]|nr:MAG: hypothetical protein KatS3mg060_1325 [Dehalococcoidia bacterium]
MIGEKDRFVRRAEVLGALVRGLSRQDVCGMLAPDVGATASARTWLGEWPRPAEPGMQSVVALGRLGVVETGSVLISEPAADRAACLLAEHLWLLLPEKRLVPTLPAALATAGDLARSGAPYLTFVSGPSRTGDIERVLTIGVHGPAALTILLVDES